VGGVSGEAANVISIEVDFSHVPVRPTSPKEVRELEIALIIGTLFRPDVMKSLLDPEEFTTWVDSLAVAAGALAREKAGYTISKIAEELGRTEATIRNHLQGKTKAGALVNETYKMLARGRLKIAVPAAAGLTPPQEVEELKKRVDSLEAEVKALKDKLSKAQKVAEELRRLASELTSIVEG
jgi:probable regulatory domain-containing protein